MAKGAEREHSQHTSFPWQQLRVHDAWVRETDTTKDEKLPTFARNSNPTDETNLRVQHASASHNRQGRKTQKSSLPKNSNLEHTNYEAHGGSHTRVDCQPQLLAESAHDVVPRDLKLLLVVS